VPSPREEAPAGRFAGNVARLASGTTLAQIVALATTPLLSRLYQPEAIGLAALFSSVVSILAVMVCFRYELAIMLPENAEEAGTVLMVSLASALLVSGILLPIALIADGPIASTLHAPSMASYVPFLPLAVLLSGWLLALTEWAVRRRQFRTVSLSVVIGAAATAAAQVAAGALGHRGGGALIAGTILGWGLSVCILLLPLLNGGAVDLRRTLEWQRAWALMKRYRSFPLVTTWTGFLNAGSWHLPSILLAGYFSSGVVGFYSLSNYLIRLPVTVVGQPLAKVFYQRAAVTSRDGAVGAVSDSTFRYALAIGLFPLLVLAVIGEEVFSVILGPRWSEAGVYAQILAPLGLMVLVSSPLNVIFNLLERQAIGLRIQTWIFVSRVGGLALGGLLGQPRLALAFFSGLGVLSYGHLVVTALKLAGVPLRGVNLFFLHKLGEWVPAGLVLIALKWAGTPPAIIVLVGIVSCLGFYLHLVRTDPGLRAFALEIVRRGSGSTVVRGRD
jgi:lipopolysaccharide exporter